MPLPVAIAALPWRIIGRWAAITGAAALAWWAVQAWTDGIRRDAMAQQRAVDEAAYANAALAAERAQQGKIDAALRAGIQIGKEASDGYARANAGIDAAADALGRLWQAEARAGVGRAGTGQATALSAAAAGIDATASCAAAGWVSLPVAVQLAAGADREAARGDALSAFMTATADQWPK